MVKQGPGAVCSIVSIRPDELCPDYALPDTESVVRFGEKVQFQTMLKKSSLVITRNHFSENTTAINIIILAKRSDEGCYSDSSFQEDAERIGNFSLFVLQQPEKLIYISTLPVLGFYIVGALLAIILGHLTFRSAWLIVHCTFCIILVLLDLNRTVDTLPAENFLNYLQFFSIILYTINTLDLFVCF